MKVFHLPDLGEGLPDAEIHAWHVKEGDDVKVDQLLLSVETAKAVVDVPSPYAGKITKLYAQAGEVVLTGGPLVEFSDGVPNLDLIAAVDKGTVAGNVQVGNTVLEENASGIQMIRSTQGVQARPAVRMLARQLGVDLKIVKASDASGQISEQDVKLAANLIKAAPAARYLTMPISMLGKVNRISPCG